MFDSWRKSLRDFYERLMPASSKQAADIRNELCAYIDQAIGNLRTELSRESLEMRKNMLMQRALLAADRQFEETDDPAPVLMQKAKSYEESLGELEKMAPGAFKLWYPLLSAGEEQYRDDPDLNCSVEGNKYAPLFFQFIRPYLRGWVLDAGCGPQVLPSYLQGYPTRLICGVDPLVPEEPHGFRFHRGFVEFLPWADGSFRTVVAAGSLDHVLLLDRAVRELHRVVRKDGQLLVWAAFVKGSSPYDPYRSGMQPVDRFHMFHFDRGWFEDLLCAYFDIEEAFRFVPPETSAFYCFRPKQG